MTDVAVSNVSVASPRPFLRVLGGATLGFVTGALLIAAIQLGAANDYGAENPRQTWGAFLWGEHAIIRLVASIMATVAASWVAGVAGRRSGGIAASLAALPSVVGWAYCALAGWMGSLSILGDTARLEASNSNKTISLVLALGTLPLAFWVGRAGGRAGEGLAPHFDSRPHSLFGVAWYHYVWLPVPLYLVAILNAWAIFYFLNLQLAAWNASALMAIIPGLLSFGLLVSFFVTYDGLATAYRILSHREVREHPASTIVKYGCGFPVLGSLLQTAVNLLAIGAARLAEWFAR